MSDKKILDFVKGSIILIIANLVIKAINFFLLPLYTKYLSPAELGISDSITNITAILLPILMMGMDSAFSAFYFDIRTEEHKRKVFNTTLAFLLIAGIIPFIIAIFSKGISIWLFNSDKNYLLVAISLISISFNLWYTPYALHARMENRMVLFAGINISASLLMIISNIFFVSVMQLGAFSLIISSAIVQLYQLLIYLKLIPTNFKCKYYNKELLHSMLKFSLPIVPTAIAAWFLSLSDRYLILYFLSTSDVGIYGIAARFSSVLSVVSSAVFTAYTSFAFDKKDDADARHQYKRILNFYYMTLMLLCIVINLCGKEIIGVMTNASYSTSHLILPGLLFGQVMYGVSVIIGYGLSFAKKTNYILLVNIIGAMVNIILNIILIPVWGTQAAAYTTYAGYFIMVILTYYFSQKFYKCDYEIRKVIISNLIIVIGIIVVNYYEISFNIRIFLLFIEIAYISILYRKSFNDVIVIINRIIKK